MTAAVREAVAAAPEPPRQPPKLGPAVVEPPHSAAPPRVAPVLARRRSGWGYAIAWALSIGVGAVAAGAFVGFLVNGPPGHSSSHRTIADVAPPTPDVPPPTPQEIVGSKIALATTPSQPEPPTTAATSAPATTPSTTTTPATAARSTLPPIPPAKPAAQPAPPSPPLSSADVREVQGRLRALGFNPGPVDGNAGPMTTTAVTRYQEAHGLKPTGVADKDMLAELRREPGSTPPPPPPAAARPRTQPYQSAAAPPPPPPPRQSNPFLDALDRMFGR